MAKTDLKVFKKKSIIVKWDGTRVVLDIPYEKLDAAINTSETIKVGPTHSIRTKAINERYEYCITDELEAWILEEFPQYEVELKAEIDRRKRAGLRVNKTILGNFVQRLQQPEEIEE